MCSPFKIFFWGGVLLVGQIYALSTGNLILAFLVGAGAGYPFSQAIREMMAHDGFTNSNATSDDQQYFLDGTQAYQACEYGLAVEKLTKAILANPEKAEYYIMRGRSYRERGESQLALNDFSIAIKMVPNTSGPYLERGLLHYVSLGDHTKALSDLKRVTHLNPNLEEPYVLRGRIHLELGNFDEAIEETTKLINMAEDGDGNAYYIRGLALLSKGARDEAISNLMRAADLGNALAKTTLEREKGK